MQLPEPNLGPGSDPCAFDGVLLTLFWLSSFSVSRYVVGSSIPATRGTRAPFVGVYERVAIGVSCSLRSLTSHRGQLAMSSGIKQCCAFGRHCVIANLRVGDRSRDDWTEIQESDYAYAWRILTLM
jgi:hypothetical protein